MQFNKRDCLRFLLYTVILLAAGCRKEPETRQRDLTTGVWVLDRYTVNQTGGGKADWSSAYDGDTRDYLDFHDDGTLESGDAWNGKRVGRYRLTSGNDLSMLVSNRADTVSVRILEFGTSSLRLVEQFRTGDREVVNSYYYVRR